MKQKKLTEVQELRKEIKALTDEQKLGSKRTSLLALHTANDLRTLQERTFLLWETTHAILNFLEEKYGFTQEEFDKHYKIVKARFHAEKLNDAKSKIKHGQHLCLECVNVVASDKVLEGSDTPCPQCKNTNWYSPPKPELAPAPAEAQPATTTQEEGTPNVVRPAATPETTDGGTDQPGSSPDVSV